LFSVVLHLGDEQNGEPQDLGSTRPESRETRPASFPMRHAINITRPASRLTDAAFKASRPFRTETARSPLLNPHRRSISSTVHSPSSPNQSDPSETPQQLTLAAVTITTRHLSLAAALLLPPRLVYLGAWPLSPPPSTIQNRSTAFPLHPRHRFRHY
jgi:hypothetical protein